MSNFYTIDLLNIDENTLSMSGIDANISNLDKNLPDISDMIRMRDNLMALKAWCITENSSQNDRQEEFFYFFENAIMGAFCRYRKSKTATWSIKKNWIKALGIALVPVLSALIMLLLDKTNQTIIGNSVPAVSALVIGFCLLQMYLEWAKNKNDKETWVRHSICYERLNLSLSKFVLSDKGNDDFYRLMNDTFAILEQNLDQFTLNLSSNGAAKRPDAAETED